MFDFVSAISLSKLMVFVQLIRFFHLFPLVFPHLCFLSSPPKNHEEKLQVVTKIKKESYSLGLVVYSTLGNYGLSLYNLHSVCWKHHFLDLISRRTREKTSFAALFCHVSPIQHLVLPGVS